jgi:hypothetical protein
MELLRPYNPELNEWLETVSEERYMIASELEKILRFSKGVTVNKMLIDKYLQNLTIVPQDQVELWNKSKAEHERVMKVEQEKAETLNRIKSDPNYEKYRDEICTDGIRESDSGFEMLFFLHKHLVETPIDILKEEFNAVNKDVVSDSDSPTVEEYLEGLNPALMRRKGYSEGAEKFMEKVIERLSDEERPLMPTSEIIALMRSIYENE